MRVELLESMNIKNVIYSIRECYDSFNNCDNGGESDKKLIRKVIKSGHTSTLEHVVYHFKIEEFSRALLQELSRHRIASPSVRSTRYTLKKMLNSSDNISDYIVLTGDSDVDSLNIETLTNLKKIMIKNPNIRNDYLKYGIPEALKVSERLTINARSLRNLLKLRLSHRALWEIRILAIKILNIIPEDHKILFEDIGV